MSQQPNILLFITDQHRADWLYCTGHPVVKTPNIDAIAADGTLFEDFHVALPVCMPNRASLMTGRMPSVHGLRHNGCLLPKRANTFVDVLAKAGYATASIGKSHLQPFTDSPPMRKDDNIKRRIEEAWKADEVAYDQEEPGSFQGDKEQPFKTPYYGFQHVDMITSHGDRCGGQYGQWFRQNNPNWQDLHNPANELPHNYTCPQAYRTPVPEEAYPTTSVGDRAVDYITGRAGQDDPFFAFVSFPDPHHPFNPPGKYWDMYHPDQFSVDLPYGAHRNPTPPMQALSAMWEAGEKPPIPQMAFRADDQHVREAMALTAGMITMIDDQIGRVVQALKDSGQYDNTVIIFTSDHGDYLGDFNLMLKGPLPLQSITRVPMIWSDPEGRAGRRTDTLASTIDISASILARAGLAPYNGMQGVSFLPALDGQTPHRDEVLIEHNDGGPRAGFSQAARVRTLRTKEWRFSTYAGEDWGELYDLRADPEEANNLWDDPAASAAKAALSLRLIDHLTRQMDESPRRQSVGLSTMARHPRLEIVTQPTPLTFAPRLSERLGVSLHIKRDDMAGPPLGGNKSRQLEYYFGAAQAAQADTILITGAVQSNFVRLAASVARAQGMQAVVQLEDRVANSDPAYQHSGNVLLNGLLGAEVMRYPEGEGEAGADRALFAKAEELRAQGRRPYIIPLGEGHPPLGALGYVDAAREIMAQDADFDVFVVASGSGATHAGLLAGLRGAGCEASVIGSCVRRDMASQSARIGRVLERLGALCPDARGVAAQDILLWDGALAPGYGQIGPAMLEAMTLMAQNEGVLLDPVYTAKAFAAVPALVADGTIPKGARVCFIHTGGLAALFGYGDHLGAML